MCTVSYIPTADGFFLTSNRDEKKTRSKAIYPAAYDNGNYKVIYPKDPDGKGTWIAINTNGVAAVLLNGAFIKHKSEPVYQKSRGLVLMDVINTEHTTAALTDMNLEGIEPFTLIVCSRQSLTELRWDGVIKHVKSLNPQMAAIWSSVTLYEQDISRKKTVWFEEWRSTKPFPLQNEIIDFHHFSGKESSEGLIINREMVKTVSITCLALTKEKLSMTYNDLQSETTHNITEVLY
ncbi:MULTISPECIES: NRDE family protein [unclassified Pedobacter]|uniref:NRDE family protein n=1 Tax=unclassified Pedobacter TaxID=2628915 RepID=UPI001E60A564|nr:MULTISPECIES: NRDE family protein [unclassified Pedobacter]